MDNNTIKSRSSGADLLRIVCMLMILTSHFFVHGGVLGTLKPEDVNFHICWFIEALCYVMVNCFVLITGYFQSASKFKLKKLLLLWGQIAVISGGAYLILSFIGTIEFGWDAFFAAATPVTSSRYWFATAYVILYMISPLLNFAIERTDKRQHFIGCAVLFGIFVFLRNFTYWKDFANLHGGYSYTSFIVLYVIGAYLRKYKVKFKHPLRWYFLLSSVTALSRIILTAFYYKFGFDSVYLKALMQYNSVTVVLASIFLFDFFIHLNIESRILSRVIKFFAPLTFGVYLIHEQIEIKEIIWKIINPSVFARSPVLYPYLILTVLCLFLICALCDYLRHSISVALKIPKLIEKISSFLSHAGLRIVGFLMNKDTEKY